MTSSTNSKGIAGILVHASLKPKDPLNKIGPMLDCVVVMKKMIDILAESHSIAKLAWSIIAMGVDDLIYRRNRKTAMDWLQSYTKL